MTPSEYELNFAHRYICHTLYSAGYRDGKAGSPFFCPQGDSSTTPILYAKYEEGYQDGQEFKNKLDKAGQIA